MHDKDADIVERGDIRLTAAFCFDVDLKPHPVDMRLHGDAGMLEFAGQLVRWIHTRGHTPGSISLDMEENTERVLFSQDIGAPLLKEFDCDPKAWLSPYKNFSPLKPIYYATGIAAPTGRSTSSRNISNIASQHNIRTVTWTP